LYLKTKKEKNQQRITFPYYYATNVIFYISLLKLFFIWKFYSKKCISV